MVIHLRDAASSMSPFTLLRLAIQLNLQIHAPIFSSSEKVRAVFDGRRDSSMESAVPALCSSALGGGRFTSTGETTSDLTRRFQQSHPPLCAYIVHPSWLQCTNVARVALGCFPCLLQTPPLLTGLVHPSWLQSLTGAPCLLQSPPRTTKLVHPSRPQPFRVTLAPCLLQTPPLTARFVHPSWPQRLAGISYRYNSLAELSSCP